MKRIYSYIRESVKNKEYHITYVRKIKSNIIYSISECIESLSEKFMERFQYKISRLFVSLYQKLSEDFIKRFQDKVNWSYISRCQVLSEDFMERFQNKIDWYYISQYQKLSESFMEKYKDKVDWKNISFLQVLSENFIEKFQDKVDWYYISQYQTLSEDFIEKFQDKVNWYYISRIQTLSENSIEKYKDKLNLRKVFIKQYFPDEFAYRILNESDYYEVINFKNIRFCLKDIKEFKPCKEGVERYLKVFKPEETMTWEEFITRYDQRDDISWLYDKIRKTLKGKK